MIRNDLEQLEIKHFEIDLHRLAQPQRRVSNDSSHRLVNPKKVVEWFIKSVFESNTWYPQRFSQERNIKAFYAALDKETAIKEIAHHIPRRFGHLSTIRKGNPVFFMHLTCLFHGSAKDVCQLANAYPELLSDRHNATCQQVAEHVRALADALITVSVRNRPEGKCIIVFEQRALEPHQVEHRVAFYFSGSDDNQISWQLSQVTAEDLERIFMEWDA
jgi:hypothetical protein